MKIYTKTGDRGQTSLIGGTRVSKDHLRIETYGTVDELNSWIGYVCTGFNEQKGVYTVLQKVQNILFTIGSLLAADPEKSKMKLPDITEADVKQLEEQMDILDAGLPALANFILPGGHALNAQAHIARCVCRRAERLVVALDREHPVMPLILIYLNRLSDYLFVLARYASFLNQTPEIPWKHEKE